MKLINYTNDGRVVIQHASLILSKLDETDTLELHTMDNAIILLKKDMTLVETRDVLQGMVRLARSMTLDALCNSDAEDKTPLVDESVDDEYEDMRCRKNTIPIKSCPTLHGRWPESLQTRASPEPQPKSVRTSCG